MINAESTIKHTYFEKIFQDEQISSAIFIVDFRGCFVKTSPAFDRLLGYGQGELTGAKLIDIVRLDDKSGQLPPAAFASHYMMRCSDRPMLMEFYAKDRSVKDFFLHGVIIEDDDGNLLEAMGFVERIQSNCENMTESIWEIQQNLTMLLENSGDGILVCNARGRIGLVNRALAEMIGYPEKDIEGKHLFDIFPFQGRYQSSTGETITIDDDYLSSQVKKANELLEKGRVTYRLYLAQREGRIVPVEGTFSSLLDRRGELRGTMCITRDITERIIAEKQLESSREFLENVFRTSGDGIIVADAWGSIVRANRSAEALTGFNERELSGRHFSSIVAKIDHSIHYRREAQKMFHMLLHRGSVSQFETVLQKNDASTCPAELNASLLKSNSGTATGIVICIRDITERKQAEHKIEQEKRREFISEVAAGIANDFDAVLTSVLGNISIVQAAYDSNDAISLALAKAERGAIRAKDLIDQLLTFAATMSIVKRRDSLLDMLHEIPRQVLKGTGINCIYDVDEDLWAVAFDRNKIGQVVKSLLINAEQSMPEGGTISIELRNKVIAEDTQLPLEPGNYVQLTIRDQGVGILNEYIQDVFNSYLKSSRPRSGLLLAAAYSIISRHSGLICVESAFGSGTIYMIYLPACES